MSIKTTCFSMLELGQRANQEDCIYPAAGEKVRSGGLFILCDGMGGHDGGEVASGTVCRAMSQYVCSHPEATFESVLNAAYDALDAHDTNGQKKMGTTMTFVKFDGNTCLAAHIGDSRIYQVRPSERRIVFVTKDHSLVNDLVACGVMTPEEARHSPQKNVITRAMQPHQEKRTKADVALLTDIRSGDYFFMCSDGMLETCADADIVRVLSAPGTDRKKLEMLRAMTRHNRDNHSAHLIRVVSTGGRAAASVRRTAKRVMPGWLFWILLVLVSIGCLVLVLHRYIH